MLLVRRRSDQTQKTKDVAQRQNPRRSNETRKHVALPYDERAAPPRRTAISFVRVLLKLHYGLLDSFALVGRVDLTNPCLPAGELVDGPAKRLWRRIRLARYGRQYQTSKQGARVFIPRKPRWGDTQP
jgi:hypothetical protein